MRGKVAKLLRKLAKTSNLPDSNYVKTNECTSKRTGYPVFSLKEQNSKKEIYKTLKRKYYAAK